MNYLLDTNIIIIYGRDNELSKQIEKKYEIFSGDNILFISIITLGEIDAFIKKFKIGKKRKEKMDDILKGIRQIALNHKEIINAYGNIDAYSQGKLNTNGSKFSSKNMGKNDIWIAATANVFDLKLFTSDKDFDHLSGKYLNLQYIDISKI